MVLFFSVIDEISIPNCDDKCKSVAKSDPVSSDSDGDDSDNNVKLNEVNDLGKTL